MVYNSRVPGSKEVAEYYAQKRQVPTNQVFGFDLTSEEAMSRAEYRDSLQDPLAKALEKQKLWHVASHMYPATNHQPARVEWRPVQSKIRYAVLCYGMPLRINADPNLKEAAAEKLRPEIRRDDAAVDSELALLPVKEDYLPLSGPLRNPVYGVTNGAWVNPTNGVLMVARLDGPTPEIARGLVDKALQAETDGLWGRAYFDLRNTSDPGYKMGDDWLRSASEICRRLGFETTVDENPGTFPAGFPMSQIAIYEGWYDSDVSGPFTRPTVEFMPGAFAYHLHSFSAVTLRSATRGWVGPLLAKGATASMGCVQEPFLSGTPEMAVFTSRFIYSGCSFGEAAYMSQPVLSWQTTVVGDPLYRPFAVNFEQLQDSFMMRHSKLVAWSFLRLLDINLANGKPVTDCAAFLEQLGTTKTSAVLLEKLGGLYDAQGKPSSAVAMYSDALKQDPSPMQKLRLLLVLGNKLIALNRPADAYDAYQTVLQDYPDYPDKNDIYRRLLPLAEKLGKKADVEKYQAILNPPTNAVKPEVVIPK